MRQYKVWRSEEETALRAGVLKHGTGAWEVIRTDSAFAASLCAPPRHLFHCAHGRVFASHCAALDVLLCIVVAAGWRQFPGPRGPARAPSYYGSSTAGAARQATLTRGSATMSIKIKCFTFPRSEWPLEARGRAFSTVAHTELAQPRSVHLPPERAHHCSERHELLC